MYKLHKFNKQDFYFLNQDLAGYNFRIWYKVWYYSSGQDDSVEVVVGYFEDVKDAEWVQKSQDGSRCSEVMVLVKEGIDGGWIFSQSCVSKISPGRVDDYKNNLRNAVLSRLSPIEREVLGHR